MSVPLARTPVPTSVKTHWVHMPAAVDQDTPSMLMDALAMVITIVTTDMSELSALALALALAPSPPVYLPLKHSSLLACIMQTSMSVLWGQTDADRTAPTPLAVTPAAVMQATLSTLMDTHVMVR